jgi:outer membrane receptor protein involved in Fe transport
MAGLVVWLSLSTGVGAQEPPAPEQPPREAAAVAAGERAAEEGSGAGDASAEARSPDDAAAAPESERAWYDSVTVTAARTTLDRSDVPANVSVLEDEVRESAGLTLDSVLRQVPGFATVREQSSVVSNVTGQSVSMRGLGGSQASRTLVLLDGVPMNDPYGGWIAWARAPREILDRVEVVRGGGASIWGNLSLGGVIHLLTVEPDRRTVSASALAGDHRTTDLTLALGDAGSEWSGWISGNAFDTDGYYTVRADQLGPIDEHTAKEYETYLGKAAYAPSAQVALRLSADWWNEDRERGTPLDRGSSEAWSAVGNAGLVTDAGTWDFHLFGRHQDWENFSVRVSLDRTSETPSNDIFDQPSDALGASATWSREVASRHRLLAGADFQRIEIEHHQDLTFRNGRFTERADVAGSQQLAGAFLQDVFTPSPRWTVQAGARFDQIRNYDGGLVSTDLTTGVVTATRDYADHEESVVNPSLGVVYRASDDVSLRSSAYTGFRAPTPGELYKGNRAQNAINEPNSELDSEHLRGAELGVDYHPSRRFFGRVNGFVNELEDLILATTVGIAGTAGADIPPCGAVPPRNACRQRNNVGRVEVMGLEFEGEYRPDERWSISLSSLLEEGEVESAPNLPQLIGKRLPQVPEQTFVLRVRWSDPRIVDAMVQGRHVGSRFEDDVNTIQIDDFTTADLLLTRRITDAIGVFVGVENVFDERFEVTRDSTGLVTVERRQAHVGVRFSHR